MNLRMRIVALNGCASCLARLGLDLPGCNTVEGAGGDIEAVGDSIKEVADDN